MYMIRKSALKCKVFYNKFSSKDLFDQFMASFKPELEVCPVCHSCGNCVIHAHYIRNLIDFVNGKVVDHQIKVTRVICKHCENNVAHAILPDLIIPYSTYGLIFILNVLADLFSGFLTIEEICAKYDIAPSTIYRWKKAFFIHKELWLGVLASAEMSPMDFLHDLMSLSSFSEAFAALFVKLTTFSFLQKHKDAAIYRQCVF